ncbi:uncharacterized protein GGS22DRAFT_199782 [Annulohypoxylon maeteangense]|uniref:uncharacterized protein n=1 Tax=Annulohypoxylon maeteangense TaxID=1927788 RepID=UPI002007C72D|nr:uncharacterized protein GGS22DRAFT_199782 [Annulohypoxylon maeteangense]KAI0885480.1 hypothetical protein GGS22DRAFT_199782 [Annulohypoxylon maeteangense]
MPPKRGAQPQKQASRKRARKGSAGAGNQTLDKFFITNPRTPAEEGEASTSASKESSDNLERFSGNDSNDPPKDGGGDEASADPSSDGRGGKNQLDLTLPPISDIDAAFWDMAKKSIELLDEKNGQIMLRVATMCSGTEAPLFALEMLRDSWERLQPGRQFLQFLHVFSAEIVGFKQAYIMRNTDATVFNDVQDFVNPTNGKAPTAMGSLEEIPGDIDVLISGCSCVEFSNLNTNKKTGYSAENLKAEHSYIVKLAKGDGYNDTEHERINKFFLGCLEALPNMGSSNKTFFSMMSYIRDHRPKVVILENVLGAPWTETQNVWFPFLGYTAFHGKLDTKDYYIPQTRNRGYLIALDNNVFAEGKTYPKKEPKKESKKEDGRKPQKTGKTSKEKAEEAKNKAEEEEKNSTDADKIGTTWWDYLTNVLPRRASSHVESWLFPPAHPLTERARQDDSEKTSLMSKDSSNWSRSRLIHDRVRREENLGPHSNLTEWLKRNGQPYDRMDRSIIQYLPDRVKDCMEINLLRALVGGYWIDKIRWVYDSRFKTRISDLSQNIHRSVNGSPFGIVGCLTPSGIHYMSAQCRMISGFETLCLQGLPLHKVEFATENQDQLRDLGGNAMTTTVAGAVFLAFIYAVSQLPGGLQKYLGRPLLLKSKPEPRVAKDSELERVVGFSTTDAEPITLQVTKELLAKCRRYCFCNGAAKYSTGDFVKCARCFTIRCRWCAGNPRHCFKPTQRPWDYLLLSEVEQAVMLYFPGTIRDMINVNWLPTAQRPLKEATIADVPGALERLRDVTFYYESVRVTEVVTICYSGQWGFDVRAKLSESGITWYLYLDPWSEIGTALKNVLESFNPELAAKYVRAPQPIATAKLLETFLSVLPAPHVWMPWKFMSIRMSVLVLKDKDTLEIADIQPTCEDFSHSQLGLMRARGKYQHFPDCDGPEKSLHAQKNKAMFLFKDVSRTLTPDLDGFVVSESCRQLESHEYREVVIKFNPGNNMTKQETGTVEAYVDGYWSESHFESVHHSTRKEYEILQGMENLKILGSKHSIIKDKEPDQQVLVEAQIAREIECDTYRTIAMYQAKCKEASDGWAIVTKADLHHLHGFISHLDVKLAGIKGLELSFELKDVEAWLKNLEDWKNGIAGASPRECPYGQLPPVRWVKVGSRYVGHHLTDAMSDFEKRYKSRIPIFEPRVKVLPDLVDNGKMYVVRVQYLLRHKALAQKAASFLLPTKNLNAQVTAGVRVERNAVLSQNIQIKSDSDGRHKFEPLRNALKSLEEFPSAKEPALDTFNGELSRSQLKSLAWTLERERGDPKFTEQEIEEEIVSELKLRLVGCAKRIVINHGGVLADDVGYGKTIIMLAVAHCQEPFDNLQSFQERRAGQSGWNYLKATLVVCPSHLVDQWAQEALRFLPLEPAHVVKIESVSDLQDDATWSLLTRLREARIILVNNEVFGQRYHQRLARLSASLDPPDLIPLKDGDSIYSRAFEDWYEDAAPAARAHVAAMFGTPNPDLSKIWDDMDRRTKALSDEYKLYASDLSRRRAKGRGTREENAGKEGVEINVQISHRIATWLELEREMNQGKFLHILETFTFARAVYDEFSYKNFTATKFFANCEAHAKWILSATPTTKDLAAVHDIAGLININVARPIYLRAGMPKITKGPVLGDQTNAEALQNRKLMSDSCIRERHEKAIEFLQTFATSNPLDLGLAGGISVEEKVIVCELSQQESIQYMTLEHDLRACGLDANMLPGGSRARFQTLLKPEEWVENGRDVSMTLFLSQSSCSSDSQSLESLLQERCDQVQRAIIVFRTYNDAGIWLGWRILDNEEESTHSNATTIVKDISMMLRDIWNRDIENCGGLDAWRKRFEALNVGVYEEKFQELVAKCPNFCNDDKNFLGFLNKLRQSSWNDYFDLKAKQVKDMKDGEAADLLKDLFKPHSGISAEPDEQLTPNKNELIRLIGDNGKGLEKFRQKRTQPARRPIPGEKPSTKKTHTKAVLHNLLRSFGVISTPYVKRSELEKQLHDHYAGTLDDSEYVGMNDSRAITRTEYPTLGGEKTIRGGKYTNTGSEASDACVGLRAALEQLDLAIKQKRIVENLVSKDENLRCDSCGQLKPRLELHIVCECGHVICADHLGLTYCGEGSRHDASGCKSLLEDATKSLALINRPRRFLDPRSSMQLEYPMPGMSSKSEMIVNYIKGIPHDDMVILFVQFDRQKEELMKVFKKTGIQFTTDPKGPTKKVRILDLDHSTSSGTNLQYANHVIFACPHLTDLQETYDSNMKQAKGRCIRYGQEKVVHVCHFVTAHTIEVDILELRRQSHILVRPGEAIGRLEHVPLAKDKNVNLRVEGMVEADSAGALQMTNGDATDGEQRVRSMLTQNEIWKVMNEQSWLSTVGIEY